MAKKMTMGEWYHNPLNIRKTSDSWQGQTNQKTNDAFCKFCANLYGYRAAFIIIFRYFERGHETVEDIIRTWAPPTENNVENYLNYVCRLGIIKRTSHLCAEDKWELTHLITQMAWFESNVIADQDVVRRAFDMAYKKVFGKEYKGIYSRLDVISTY